MSLGREHIIAVMVFACAFLFMQAVIGAGRNAARKVRARNERLRRLDTDDPHETVLQKMRKDRRLNQSGQIASSLRWLNTLLMRSGTKVTIPMVCAATAALPVMLGALGFVLRDGVMWGIAGIIIGALLPIAVLKKIVTRRMNKAAAQLPEALDIIIRSLGAGHPVPVALGLVGREMADPLGSEFGMACDEIAYGAPLAEAVQRISDRIGQEDFDLFAANIRLQERTGGNLAELLRNNAKTIRDRQKMRMKIKAASAEGRMSAMILNIAPILLYLAVNMISPEFYGEVKDSPYVKWGLVGVVVWMVIGNLVMRRMINFRI